MVCCSIHKGDFDIITKLLETVEMAEIRLDCCEMDDNEIEAVFSSDIPLVATCRAGETPLMAEHKLLTAIRAGAHYVDLEIEAAPSTSRKIARACDEYGTVLIRSFHDYAGTPDAQTLRSIVDKCRHYGGSVVKVVTTARTPQDAETVMGLYRYYTAESLIAFAMGEEEFARNTRLECLAKGAPFSYAAMPDTAPGLPAGDTAPNASASGLPAGDTAPNASAPGQLPYDQMFQTVYGPAMAEAPASYWATSLAGVPRASCTHATIRVPASKSYAQRAIIAAALAEGTSVLKGYTPCGDSESALDLAVQLGAKVVRRSADGPAEVRLAANAVQTLEITGIAASPGCLDSAQSAKTIPAQSAPSGKTIPAQSAPPGKTSPSQSAPSHYFNVGESGLLARLMIPLSAQLCGEAIINGEGTLTTRSLDLPATLAGATLAGATLAGVTLAGATLAGATFAGATPAGATLAGVTLAGATLASSETAHPGVTSPAANSAATVPISVTGPLTPGRIIMDGRHSSQISSGLIMALPLSARNSSVHIKAPTSIPYLFMTAEVARTFGIKLRSEMYSGNRILEDDWSGCTEIVLKMRENQRYKAATLALEGDWSAAAPFLAYGAIFGAVTLEGLDTTSLQADICFLDILMEAGASISQLDEPRGPISVHKAPLFPFKADLSNSPDLFPVTAVLCAFCQGRSALRGVHRLAHKESDRARAILEMLAKLGVQASIKGDDLFIEGHSLASRHLTKTLLHGGSFTSYSDHRMVMALTLAGFGADAPVVIDDVACVAKSFPDFLEKFRKI